MLALGDHMVWATIYGALGLGLPQCVTHSVWCLRTQPLLLTQLRQEQRHKHQKPQRAHRLFTSPSVLQTCSPALEARTGWSRCLALGMRDSNSQKQS